MNAPEIFASFVIGDDGVERYEWGNTVGNPGGLLAAMLCREQERLGSVAKLADVVPE